MQNGRTPTLDSIIHAAIVGFVTGLTNQPPDDSAVSRLVCGTHPFMEFEDPVLGRCRIHAVADMRQQDYCYVVRQATATCRILGVLTEILGTVIEDAVDAYIQKHRGG